MASATVNKVKGQVASTLLQSDSISPVKLSSAIDPPLPRPCNGWGPNVSHCQCRPILKTLDSRLLMCIVGLYPRSPETQELTYVLELMLERNLHHIFSIVEVGSVLSSTCSSLAKLAPSSGGIHEYLNMTKASCTSHCHQSFCCLIIFLTPDQRQRQSSSCLLFTAFANKTRLLRF